MFLEVQMNSNREFEERVGSRRRMVLIVILSLGAIALVAGAAHAAMRSIQLDSAASFPVEI